MARPGGRPLFDCSRPSRLADRPPDEPPGAVALSTPVVCPSPGEAHAGIGITCRHDLAAFGASCCIEMRPDLGRVARVVAKAGGSSRGSHRHTGSPKNPEYSFNSPRTRSPPHSASSSASSLEAVSTRKCRTPRTQEHKIKEAMIKHQQTFVSIRGIPSLSNHPPVYHFDHPRLPEVVYIVHGRALPTFSWLMALQPLAAFFGAFRGLARDSSPASSAACIDRVPKEVADLIFTYLAYQDLARLSRTSKIWRSLAIPFLYRAVDLRDSRISPELHRDHLEWVRELTAPAGEGDEQEGRLSDFLWQCFRLRRLVLVGTRKYGLERALRGSMRRPLNELIELDIDISSMFTPPEWSLGLRSLPERAWRITLRCRRDDGSIDVANGFSLPFFLEHTLCLFPGLAELRLDLVLVSPLPLSDRPFVWTNLAPCLRELRLTGSALNELAGVQCGLLREIRLDLLGLYESLTLEHVRHLESLPVAPKRLVLLWVHEDLDRLRDLVRGFIRYPSVEIHRPFGRPSPDLGEALMEDGGISHLRIVLHNFPRVMDSMAYSELGLWEEQFGPPVQEGRTATFVWPQAKTHGAAQWMQSAVRLMRPHLASLQLRNVFGTIFYHSVVYVISLRLLGRYVRTATRSTTGFNSSFVSWMIFQALVPLVVQRLLSTQLVWHQQWVANLGLLLFAAHTAWRRASSA
ncbi:hypothetical protein DFJ74DRAFT_29999 [Hyaloraphidium curvatum]|nr:hypothetical protein DFJ74DRAFT_29798 [Hyaloraphidium curvatum]KAI9026186.1 hypothetical protein DFJ74DRAFT_29999 [Hyaloraphidium curvatum]